MHCALHSYQLLITLWTAKFDLKEKSMYNDCGKQVMLPKCVWCCGTRNSITISSVFCWNCWPKHRWWLGQCLNKCSTGHWIRFQLTLPIEIRDRMRDSSSLLIWSSNKNVLKVKSSFFSQEALKQYITNCYCHPDSLGKDFPDKKTIW